MIVPSQQWSYRYGLPTATVMQTLFDTEQTNSLLWKYVHQVYRKRKMMEVHSICVNLQHDLRYVVLNNCASGIDWFELVPRDHWRWTSCWLRRNVSLRTTYLHGPQHVKYPRKWDRISNTVFFASIWNLELCFGASGSNVEQHPAVSRALQEALASEIKAIGQQKRSVAICSPVRFVVSMSHGQVFLWQVRTSRAVGRFILTIDLKDSIETHGVYCFALHVNYLAVFDDDSFMLVLVNLAKGCVECEVPLPKAKNLLQHE